MHWYKERIQAQAPEMGPAANLENLDLRRRLESGEVVCFDEDGLAVPAADRAFLLSVEQSSRRYHKNISYRPLEDRLRGVDPKGADLDRLRQVMRAWSRQATAFAAGHLPAYAASWQLDYASFRPIEETGRKLRRTARND